MDEASQQVFFKSLHMVLTEYFSGLGKAFIFIILAFGQLPLITSAFFLPLTLTLILSLPFPLAFPPASAFPPIFNPPDRPPLRPTLTFGTLTPTLSFPPALAFPPTLAAPPILTVGALTATPC